MLVQELMSRRPKTCSPEDTLDVVARLLWDHDLGAIPVISGARTVGMITDRDVCMAAYTQGRPLREIPVSTAMSGALHAVRASDELSEASRLMREQQVRRLPVVDGEGKLEGMLTINDLVLDAALGGEVSAQEVVETLASVVQPRGAVGASALAAASA